MNYFDQQNEKLFDFLNQTFGINKYRHWDDIAKQITVEKVKTTYRVFSDLFPLRINYIEELKKVSGSFSNIHYGPLKGSKIIDEIVRFSLYSDTIIVFHPLQNPVVTSQQMDPRKRPRYWLPDFLEALYFYTVIQRWVRAGIVKLIVNPYYYDKELFQRISSEAKKRGMVYDDKRYADLNDPLIDDYLAEQYAVILRTKNKSVIVDKLLQSDNPKFTLEEAERFAENIINVQKNINPLYSKLNIPLEGEMFGTLKGGGPAESILFLSENLKSNIYTPSKMNWQIFKDMQVGDFWTKFNHFYSKIPLQFLNQVDTSFALELRKENRLAGVRQQLKKLYSELNNTAIDKITDTQIQFLHEGFIEEVKKAEAEWSDINRQAESARRYWVATNIAAPIITNDLHFIPLAVASLAWLYNSESNLKQRHQIQRDKNPISVFVDLKNRRQGFFSELKNCIF